MTGASWRSWIGLALIASLAAAGRTSANPATEASPAPAAARLEYGGYQKLLDDFLTVTSKKGEPFETSFDYIKLYRDTSRTRRFKQARAQLLAVPPSQMSPAARTAWAINTYNYLILETATNHLYRRARNETNQYERIRELPMERFLGPAEISIAGTTFFRKRVVEVEDKRYSLEQFERHFLFADHPKSSTAPPDSLDPRLHFAIVNGSVGAPALRPRAYRGDSLDAELDDAVRQALANPRHLRWDESAGVLEASSLFEWFAADFGGANGVMAFLARHAPHAVRGAIERGKVTGIGKPLAWDWKFNQTL